MKKQPVQLMNSETTRASKSAIKFHTMAKKKLEKIKNKFTEFFLQPSKSAKSRHISKVSESSSNISSSSDDNISNSTAGSKGIEQSRQEEEEEEDLPYFHHNQFYFRNLKNLERFDNQYQTNSDGKREREESTNREGFN